jgi:hypothetical protein
MPAGPGQNATFTITADATQALKTFDQVTRAALATQRSSAAGTPGASKQFIGGQFGEARREARAYLADLQKIEDAAKHLRRGGQLGAGIIPGFTGGTVAQAQQHAAAQAQRRIAGNVAQRAAEQGVANPGNLIREQLNAFNQAFGGYTRKRHADLVNSLDTAARTAARPSLDLSSLGTANQIQLASTTKQALKHASQIQDNVLTTLRDTAAATGRMSAVAKADARIAEHAAATGRTPAQVLASGAAGGPPTNIPLPPIQPATGPSGPALLQNRPKPLNPLQVNDQILQDAYRTDARASRRRGELAHRAEREMNQSFARQEAMDQRRGALTQLAMRQMEQDFQRRGIQEARATRQMQEDLQRRGTRETRAARENDLRMLNAAHAENERRTGASLRNAAGGLAPGTIPFGQYVADLRGNVLELFKHTGEGLRRVGRDTAEYARHQQRINENLARQDRPGIGGAFFSGLASGGFGGGADGTIGEGLARSAATTVKYAALGSLLYGLTGAAAQATQEFLDFDDSVTELAVAFETSDNAIRGNQDLLGNLAQSASEAGSNIGEAMDAAASAVRAFQYDTETSTERSQEDLQKLAIAFSREGNRIAILTKTTLTDAMGNLKAITLGFDVDENAPQRVTDALANAKLVGGGDEKQIGQGVANISVAANEAGFSLEEMGNIVSDVIAKTDQGGQLVAQRLSRIFSIIGGTAGQTAIRNLNAQLAPEKQIDQGPKVTTAQQVKQLSEVYGELSEAQKKTLINQLGGTANARELIILLQDAGHLTKQSSLESAGKGAEEYRRRLANVRAELGRIRGNLRNLIAAIGNSGVLAPLDLILKATVLITEGVRKLAEGFNSITPAIRLLAGGLLGILITMKAIRALRIIDPETGQRGPRRILSNLETRYLPGQAFARMQIEDRRNAMAGADPARDVARAAAAQRAQRQARDAVREQAERQARRDAIRERLNPAQPVLGTRENPGAVRRLFGSFRAFEQRIDASANDWARRAREHGTTAYRGAGGGLAGVPAFMRAYGNTNFSPYGQTYDINTRQVTGSRGIGNRIRDAGASGRAQLNQAGLFGGLAIFAIGAVAIKAAADAGKRIEQAVQEFGKLSHLPKSYGVEDLRESVQNLRSAASTLREASGGFFGTISNALRGDPTGVRAGRAEKTADYQELLANRLEGARNEAARGQTEDLKGAIDPGSINISSEDTLSDSIEGLGKSGRDATEIMAAFQKRLEGLAVAGEVATRALSQFEAGVAAESTGANVRQAFLNSLPEDKSLAASTYGAEHPNLTTYMSLSSAAARRMPEWASDLVVGPEATNALKNSERLLNIDPNKVASATVDATKEFFAGGGDVNDKESLKLLRASLVQQYKKIPGLDPGRIEEMANLAIIDVVGQYKTITSVTDTSASFASLAAVIPDLAANAGAKKAVDITLAGDLSRTGELVGAQEELDQMQQGLLNLENKTDGSEGQLNQMNALRAQINAKKVEVAKATVANMESLYQVYAASIPPENTVQSITERMAQIDAQLETAGLDAETVRALQAEKMGLYQQLPAQVIEDTYATQRGGVDSRDTLANDRIDIAQTEAELADFRTRGVTGKALADKERLLADQKRKYAEDQADLALAQELQELSTTSAVDQATANTLQAKANMDKTLQGTAAYATARKEWLDAIDAQAQADLDASQLRRQLSIDLSNPVQAANEQLKSAREELALAKEQGKSPDEINQKKLDVRNAELQAEAAAFSQFLSNVQNAEQLGDISHKAYMNLLKGRLTALQAELATMDPKSNGYQQIQDQITQLRLALKAGADELSGQFNVGDIRVPTPYEVRRALKAGRGDILSVNGSNSTAGNVTNDNSTKNVILNGVPLEQIMAMIEDLFGKKARSRASRRTP